MRAAFLVAFALALQAHALDPDHPAFRERAPDRPRVRLSTTRGDIELELRRAWSPLGVDRFVALVRQGFYDGACFFRVVDGAWAQFGIHPDPQVAQRWRHETLADEPVVASNLRGRVAYAHGVAPNDRTTQLFINLRDNARLDEQDFPPIGEVVAGMDVADALYAGYGESAGGGIRGGKQDPIFEDGHDELRARFPELDCIDRATVLP